MDERELAEIDERRAQVLRDGTAAGALCMAADDVPALVAEVRRLAAALDAVTAERDAFRAIIEGRTAPPTFAERVAHMEAHRRNRWMARASTGAVVIGDFDDPPMWAALTTLIPVCWWPLDADGRPCAWPTAEVSR